MKFNVVVLMALAAAVVGKNVFNFDVLKDLSDNSKRDAKNVYTFDTLLTLLKEELAQKRDAKYVVDISSLLDHLESESSKKREEQAGVDAAVVKRDARNVVDLDSFLISVDSGIQKRDAKNLVTVGNLAAALEEEQKSKSKRDAKNTVNLEDFLFKLDSIKKRHFYDDDEQEQQVLANDNKEQLILADAPSNLLQSLLTQIPDLSIFASYIRDNEEIAKMTQTVDGNMLIICPTDDAISNKLHGLKPWEFPTLLTGGDDDEEIAKSNINFYLANHIVTNYEPNRINVDGEDVDLQSLLSGLALKIKTDVNGYTLVNVGNTWVPVRESRKVDNGLIFIINDSLVKP